MVARERTLGRHVAQLVERDDDRGHRELNVNVVENVRADCAGGLTIRPASQDGLPSA